MTALFDSIDFSPQGNKETVVPFECLSLCVIPDAGMHERNPPAAFAKRESGVEAEAPGAAGLFSSLFGQFSFARAASIESNQNAGYGVCVWKEAHYLQDPFKRQ